MNKKVITFAIYLNENSSSLNLCLNQLTRIDKEDCDVIIYLDSNSQDLNITIENLFLNNTLPNFTLIKNSTHLNKAFCFNDALNSCNSEYIMFLDFNSVLENNFFLELKPYLDKNYDVISVDKTNPNIFFRLNEDEYTKINSELILSNATKSIYDKLFNVDFLKNNDIKFNDDKWYPDYLMFQVLLTFKRWRNLKGSQIITFRKNSDVDFNLYDLLAQVQLISNLATSNQLNDEFKEELEFWYAYIAKYSFLSKFFEKYQITKSNKILSTKNKEIQKLAIQNVNKIVKLFCENLTKNQYYKIFKKILEIYSN